MKQLCKKMRSVQKNLVQQLKVLILTTVREKTFTACVREFCLFGRTRLSLSFLFFSPAKPFAITKACYHFLPVVVFAALLLTSCGPQRKNAVFQHPMVGVTSGYHAMPVSSDSIKAATYADASFSIGQMGVSMHDDIFSFQGRVHRAVLLDNVRLYGGCMVALGNYRVKPYNGLSLGLASGSLDSQTHNRFFGSYGVFGGVSLSAPVKRRHEWRYIGIEGGICNEFGNFLSFRKSLPDSVYRGNDRNSVIGSLGLTTEVIFKRRSGFKSGLKFANGLYFRNIALAAEDPANLTTDSFFSRENPLFYFSFTYHLSKRRSTIYFQLNGASRTTNLQFGYNYRF